jgi:hypothetical protein
LFNDIIPPFLVVAEVAIQKVVEKEETQNGKHDEKLDQDNDP